MPTFQAMINGCDILEFESDSINVFQTLSDLLQSKNLKCIIKELDDDGEEHYFGEINDDGFTSMFEVDIKLMNEDKDWKVGIWKQKCPKYWLPQEDIPF